MVLRLIALLALAGVIFVLPIPDRSTLPLVRAAWRGAPLVIVGNSVIDNVSACDADKRNLASMISDRAGLVVADASDGGQSLYQSQLLARLAMAAAGRESSSCRSRRTPIRRLPYRCKMRCSSLWRRAIWRRETLQGGLNMARS